MKHAEKLLVQFVENLEARGEVVPGTSTRILRHLPAPLELGPIFKKAMELLTGFGNAFLTPKGKRSIKAEVPSKFLLDRLPLKEGSAEQLYNDWAAGLVEFDPPHQAKLILDRLMTQGHEGHLEEHPYAAHHRNMELRALAALRQFRFAFDPEVKLEELAKEWSKDLGPLPHHRACRMVATRIGHPDIAGAVCRGGRPVHVIPSDERFTPLDPEEDRAIGKTVEASIEKERAAVMAETESLKRQIAEKEAENAAMDKRLREYEASRS